MREDTGEAQGNQLYYTHRSEEWEAGHAMPRRATWGSTRVIRRQKTGVRGQPRLYWGSCRKGRARQGEQFGIG